MVDAAADDGIGNSSAGDVDGGVDDISGGCAGSLIIHASSGYCGDSAAGNVDGGIGDIAGEHTASGNDGVDISALDIDGDVTGNIGINTASGNDSGLSA